MDAPDFRFADFSMSSDADRGESESNCVPVVAGDSWSLRRVGFSLCSVSVMQVLSCDLRGIKLHESTQAAMRFCEPRPFHPCCATYIFTDGSGEQVWEARVVGIPHGLSVSFNKTALVSTTSLELFQVVSATMSSVPLFSVRKNETFTAELTALTLAVSWVCLNPSDCLFQI